MKTFGKLYMIPTDLGTPQYGMLLPADVIEFIRNTKFFIAERAKTTRSFLSKLLPGIQHPEITVFELDKHKKNDYMELLAPCFEGHNVGFISEAGCPGIADPGAEAAWQAHEMGIEVVPLVGPSSILLTLMASGLNGQSFAFQGYLPIDEKERNRKLKQLELISTQHHQTQVFIETPYRNEALFQSLCKVLLPNTKLCLGINLTHSQQKVITKKVSEWQSDKKPNIAKLPCVFAFQS